MEITCMEITPQYWRLQILEMTGQRTLFLRLLEKIKLHYTNGDYLYGDGTTGNDPTGDLPT